MPRVAVGSAELRGSELRPIGLLACQLDATRRLRPSWRQSSRLRARRGCLGLPRLQRSASSLRSWWRRRPPPRGRISRVADGGAGQSDRRSGVAEPSRQRPPERG
eukprot:9481927-Pyramimonas_sp.AAC.1